MRERWDSRRHGTRHIFTLPTATIAVNAATRGVPCNTMIRWGNIYYHLCGSDALPGDAATQIVSSSIHEPIWKRPNSQA